MTTSEKIYDPDMPDGFDEEGGLYDLGEGFSGRLSIPRPPRLPSGQVRLHDAIKRFCASHEGKSADKIDFSRFQAIVQPVRTALLDERLKVTCLTHEGVRLPVSGDAFVDDETWWAVCYGPDSVPIRPKIGIDRGHLVVLQDDFDNQLAEKFPITQPFTCAQDEYIPPYIEFMMSCARKLDLTADYNFSKPFMVRTLEKISKEKRWEALKISPSALEEMARMLGHPQFADPKSGRKNRICGAPPSDYVPRSGPERNVGRTENPEIPYNADYLRLK